MESYENLLNSAYENVKDNGNSNLDRWEMPKLAVQNSGSKTIVSNFGSICSYIRRECEHVSKFLSKELATSSKFENGRLILKSKISIDKIESKLKRYLDKFVICESCKKPDTEIEEKDGNFLINCLACGSRNSLGKL
jgi:translation initiation factor 2 subunit 2